MDDDGQDPVASLYRLIVVAACFLELGLVVYALADHLSDGDLHRWAEQRQQALRKSVREARARAREERETRRQAARVVFEAWQIVEEAS